MAHFAQLDDNNVVTQVIVVANEELLDNGVESEAKGVAFCQSLLGGNWKQTSYNGTMRKNYAGVGFVYDVEKDAFIAPKPYPSWILNEDAKWVAPIERPTDVITTWDEETESWVPAATTTLPPIG
jgi:hypothetical protein